MSTLSIGQLARAAHVNLETIRYYERRGFFPEQWPLTALNAYDDIRSGQDFDTVEIFGHDETVN